MDRITRLFGVQPASRRNSLGRWAVPGLMAVLVATALFAASCEPNLIEEPIETSADHVDAHAQDQAILELHGDHAAARLEAAFGNGGHFILHEEGDNSFEARARTKQEIHDLLKNGGEVHELTGDKLHWVSEDGTELNNEFFEERAGAIIEYKAQTAEQAERVKPAESKETP